VAFAVPFTFNNSGQTSNFGWSADSASLGHTGTDSQNMGSPSVNQNGVSFINEFGDMNYTVDSGTPSLNSHVEWGVSTVGAVVFGANVPASNPGGAAPITTITVRESGTFVSSSPSTDFSVTQSIGIQFFDPIPAFPHSLTGYLANLPQPTYNLIDGTWEAELVIDITSLPLGDGGSLFAPNGAKTMAFDLVNLVSLSPGAPVGASFTKTRAEVFLPEPGTVCLLGLGIMVVGIRRRQVRN
jgi:hypothetical protein